MRQNNVLKTIDIIITNSIRFEKNGPHVKNGFTHYRINKHDANTIREQRNTRQQRVSKHNLNNTQDVNTMREKHTARETTFRNIFNSQNNFHTIRVTRAARQHSF